MASERTKQCRIGYWICAVIHILLMFGPLAYYLPTAFTLATPTVKVVMGLAFVIAFILALLMLVVEAKSRGGMTKSIMWIVILAISFALDQVKVFIYIMAIASIIDELIVVRIKNHYDRALSANKEIDRRI